MNEKLVEKESIYVVFAREIADDGTRYFFCEKPATFYEKCLSMTKVDLTFYEVILPNSPTKIFFDLELKR